MPGPTPVKADLSGIWAYDQRQVPDDRAAVKLGHVDHDGKPQLHGTWTRIYYLVARREDDGRTLILFDENGGFCRLTIVAGTEAGIPTWTSSPDPVTFTYPDQVVSGISLKSGTRIEYPTLQLAKYTKDDCVSNKAPGDLYVQNVGNHLVSHDLGVQTVAYHQLNNTFIWSTPAYQQGLVFNRVARQEGVTEGPPFSETFAGQSEFAQTAFPFYGFDPRHMNVFTNAGSFQTAGTSLVGHAYDSNPGQVFVAPLLFQFPLGSSHDYIRFLDLPHQPNLPIGRYGYDIDIHSRQEHSAMLEQISDRLSSWSVTLGLSAGVEKMLTGSSELAFGAKTEEQRRNESRYTVARVAELQWVNLIVTPSLKIKEEFLASIMELAYTLLSGGKPFWEAFVGHYGTHYLHAMTQGALEYSETRFSLSAEVNASGSHVSLTNASKSVLDGGKVSGKSSISAEWEAKNGLTVSEEDIQTFGLGQFGHPGVGILYDLRPVTELLNPVLFRYNPADPWQRLAPWVWSQLRAGLDGYLSELGLNQPIDASCFENYMPHLVKVTFPQVKVTEDDQRWMAGHQLNPLYAKGSIKLSELDGDPNGLRDAQFGVAGVNYTPDYVRVEGDGAKPADTGFSATLALRRSNKKPRLKLDFDLDIFPGNYAWQQHNVAFATFTGSQVIDCDLIDKSCNTLLTPIRVQQSRGLNIYYTLDILVHWEQAGLLGQK